MVKKLYIRRFRRLPQINSPFLPLFNKEGDVGSFKIYVLCGFVGFLLSVFLCHADAVDDILKIHKLEQENSLLELELKLAVKPSVYAVLDIEAKKIYLKIKGVVLKEFDIATIETIGSVNFNRYYSIIKRKAVFPPKRIEIKPHKKEKEIASGSQEAAQQADSFDIEDMPSDYTLTFDEGLSISVSPRFTGGFFISVINKAGNGLRHIWNSSCRVWNYFKKMPFVKIQVVMDRDDARSLYWSLLDNMDFILIDSE